MRSLQKQLNHYFKEPIARQSDPYRKSRAEAKKLACAIGIEIEAMRPGFNVWPPKDLDGSADEFSGDHYACDWDDVLVRVKAYSDVLSASAN